MTLHYESTVGLIAAAKQTMHNTASPSPIVSHRMAIETRMQTLQHPLHHVAVVCAAAAWVSLLFALLLTPRSGHGATQETVEAVRFRSEANATRVVIETSGVVRYATGRLSQPERLYIDLRQARLAAGFSERNLQVGDERLRAIRIAQHQKGVVRVVLDLQTALRDSVFTLHTPDRIVIDLEGQTTAPTAQPVAPLVAKSTQKPDPKPQAKAVAKPPRQPLVLVIDPGHGGKDPGAVGPGGLQEKQVVLQVAKELRQIIQRKLPQYRVVMTREDDVYVPLTDRAQIANTHQADAFVSIHANASDRRKIRGIETWYLSFAANSERAQRIAARENNMSTQQLSALELILHDLQETDRINQSALLAGMTQTSLVRHMERHNSTVPNRGVDGAPFMVLLHTTMPSVLVEIGFVSNPKEAKQLRNRTYQKALAQGIFTGIHEFLGKVVTQAE
jgi:N-acetylmuramoyl-L-alanine amidase